MTGCAIKNAQIEFPDAPSKPLHEGFVWGEVAGDGIRLWAQQTQNQNIAVVTEPNSVKIRKTLPNNKVVYKEVIKVLDIDDKNINSLIPKLKGANDCKFVKLSSKRSGVKRFVLVPAKNYKSIQKRKTPIPSTCGGWGVGNSGLRYFEIQRPYPHKVIFVEIGQDQPLFDEDSITLTR